MKNKEMLRKIYYENKAINRNMQRLVNIGLIGILGGIAKEAKASDDPKAKILVKAGMVMIDDEHFTVNVNVHVSRQFLGWVFSLGDGIKIVGPDDVVEQMRSEIKRLIEHYS